MYHLFMGYTFTANEPLEFKQNWYLRTQILLKVSSIYINIQNPPPPILQKLKTIYFNILYLEFSAGNKLKKND